MYILKEIRLLSLVKTCNCSHSLYLMPNDVCIIDNAISIPFDSSENHKDGDAVTHSRGIGIEVYFY